MFNRNEKAGRLRHQCTFLTPSISRDANGDEVLSWSEGSAIWCNLNYTLSGSDEREIGARIHPISRVLVTLRYDSTITEKMRIKFDGNEHNILAIAPDAHRKFMQIECEQDKPE